MQARHARRRPSRTSLAAMVVVTAVAGAIAHRAADWWPPAGPFVEGGAVGELVEVPPVSLVVHGARAATVLSEFGDDEGASTDGVWIVVDVTASALDEPSVIMEMALRDVAGRMFRQSNRTQNVMVGRAFEPGIAERGDVVFEVPRDALRDLVLVVSPDAPGRVAPRATAEIPLRVGDVTDEPVTPRRRALAT